MSPLPLLLSGCVTTAGISYLLFISDINDVVANDDVPKNIIFIFIYLFCIFLSVVSV